LKVGVLALQGDFREHIAVTQSCGVEAIAVKTRSEIEAVDALIIPGGESTTISKLAKTFDLFDPISKLIAQGLPTYGSCAGMILVSKEIVDPASGQETFGGIDMVVRRNAFGKQVDSFESDLTFHGISGAPIRGIFIRAPWVENYGDSVAVLSEVSVDGKSHPVAVKQGNVLATSFHPEISGDMRVHEFFINEIARR
jgi:pyridoxal 5'-phosphate synthase pdxT subunit